MPHDTGLASRLIDRWRLRGVVAAAPLALVAALALAGCQASAGSWEALATPHGNVYALTRDPSVPRLAYAGAAGGKVYRMRIESPGAAPGTGIPSDATVAALVADPQHLGRVYAGTDRGVYISDDYGDTWRARGRGLPSDDGVDALALGAPGGSSARLFAGTNAHAVYASDDAGNTWSASSAGLPAGAGVFGLTYDAPTATLYAALTQAGVFASADGGQTWVARGAGLPAKSDSFALLPLPATGSAGTSATGETFYLATSKGVFTSADSGQMWHAAGLSQTRVLALASDPTSAGTVYAGTAADVYRSSDGGQSWAAVAPGIHQAVNAVVVLPDQQGHPIVYVGTDQLLRYPALPGSNNPAGLAFSLLFFLVLAGAAYYFLRRTRRQMRSLATPPSATQRPLADRDGQEGGPPSQNGATPGGADARRRVRDDS
jgi:photosystem II stability/assembly factor-like uncharacterized protein